MRDAGERHLASGAQSGLGQRAQRKSQGVLRQGHPDRSI